MNIRKIISTVILSTVVFNSTIAMAAPLSEQLQQQKSQLEQNRDNLQEAEDKREDIESAIQDMDVEIEETMDLIEEYKKKIKDTTNEIKTAEAEIKKAEEDLKKQEELLGNRVRALYKNGQVNYLNMVIGSESFDELLSNIANIKRIIDYDKEVIDETELKKEELSKKQEQLAKQKESIIAMEKDSENKLLLIKEKSKEQNALIEELRKQERIFEVKVNQSQDAVNATLAQIQSIRSTTPKYVPSRGATSISDNAIIAYASNFLGTPYLWGGTLPSTGFDCSGFTRYVYAHFGVSLGRTTKDQIKNGYAVSKDQLKTGDLVFFGKGGVPNHMGIYVGNNTYIHSPQTGDVVKISAMTRKDFITGRRVK